MSRRTLAVVALGAALVLLSTGVAAAKKPVKPPPTPVDSGVIYFLADYTDPDGVTSWVTHSMEPDGSDKTPLVDSSLGRLSPDRHWCDTHQAMERWFLELRQVSTSTYPNGVYRHEFFAVCESGTAYQLTSASDVEPDHTTVEAGQQPSVWHPRPRWADGDTMVSYVAKRWSNGSIVEWGFYVLSIDPDNLDDHTAAAPTYIDVELDLKPVDVETYDKRVNAVSAWAPDGMSFIYTQGAAGAEVLMRADYDETTDTWTTTELGDGTVSDWAPMADRILFKVGGAISTMDPYDPTDVTTLPIATVFGKKTTTYVGGGRWSPNGTHIAYQVTTQVNRTFERSGDIYIALADGSGRTNLTGDTESDVGLLGWVGD